MPSPLAAAIDDLLAFLHSHPVIHGDDRERFDELDSRVYVEAHRLGILDQLPQPPPPPIEPYEFCADWLGKTNVFGFWQDSKPPNAKGVLPFMVIRETQWQTDITALRALAEAKGGNQPADKAMSRRGGRPTKDKPSVNALLLALILKQPECKGWTAKEIAINLKRSPSAVKETKAWKQLGELRCLARAEKKIDKAKRRPR